MDGLGKVDIADATVARDFCSMVRENQNLLHKLRRQDRKLCKRLKRDLRRRRKKTYKTLKRMERQVLSSHLDYEFAAGTAASAASAAAAASAFSVPPSQHRRKRPHRDTQDNQDGQDGQACDMPDLSMMSSPKDPNNPSSLCSSVWSPPQTRSRLDRDISNREGDASDVEDSDANSDADVGAVDDIDTGATDAEADAEAAAEADAEADAKAETDVESAEGSEDSELDDFPFRKRRKNMHVWNVMFNNLKRFMQNHSGALPSTTHRSKQYGSLGTWICNQRTGWKNFKTGPPFKPGQYRLDAKQVALLNSIGFSWSSLGRWENSFRELHAFVQREQRRRSDAIAKGVKYAPSTPLPPCVLQWFRREGTAFWAGERPFPKWQRCYSRLKHLGVTFVQRGSVRWELPEHPVGDYDEESFASGASASNGSASDGSTEPSPNAATAASAAEATVDAVVIVEEE